MVHVIRRTILPLTEREEREIVETLSPAARERLEKKKEPHLRLSSLCALSLLTSKQRAQLEYTAEGRPYFRDISGEISITHSRTLAAVAISDTDGEFVGIDAEDIRRERGEQLRFMSVAERFFTERELSTLVYGIEPERIWAKKEALFKYRGGTGSLLDVDSTDYGDARFVITQLEDTYVVLCMHKDSERYR